MTLYPLHAHERSPLGVFPLEPGQAVEGGMVGELVDSGVVADTRLPEVDLFDDNAGGECGYGYGCSQISLVGLIDESSTGLHYGVTGVGTPLRAGVTELTGTPSGPATHFASGKCTLWTDPGLFATDIWDTTDGTLGAACAGVLPGQILYGVAGLLVTVGNNPLGRFVRRFVGGLAPVDDFDSWFIPRVQPLPAGRIFMVLKFK